MNKVERSFLGCIMQHNHLIQDTSVKAEYFSESLNANVFRRMQQLAQQNKPIEFATMLFAQEDQGLATYFLELERLANEANFEKYEQIILEAYQKRSVRNVLSRALEDELPLEQILAQLNQLEMHTENDRHTARDMAAAAFDIPYTPFCVDQGVSTGLETLDLYTGGLRKNELIIVAARPSVGKTALAINLALGAARDNTKVVFFSLEMGEQQLRDRFLAHIGCINLNKFKDPFKFFTEQDKHNWSTITGSFSQLDIDVFDKPAQTMQEIRSKARKAVREAAGKNVVVIIDYLTLIEPNDSKATTHVQVSQISKGLKNIAREFGISVVCLAQLSRKVEERQDKRPLMSDLRESGSIEQDADVIALLYRDSYYFKEKEPDMVLEINIAKNRQGNTGTFLSVYDRKTGIIQDMPRQESMHNV